MIANKRFITFQSEGTLACQFTQIVGQTSALAQAKVNPMVIPPIGSSSNNFILGEEAVRPQRSLFGTSPPVKEILLV